MASFEACPGVKLNGQLTLGENTADNGGLRLAYMALMDTVAEEAPPPEIDGYTRPSGFSWPSARWCSERTRAGSAELCLTDPHSPGIGG